MFVSQKVLFVFSTFVVAAFAASTESRIVGGVVAATASVPSAVSVQTGFFGANHICGGTVIGNRYVLTSGHCVHTIIGPLAGIPLQHTTCRVGTNYRSSGGTRYVVASGTLHPEFHSATGFANLGILTTLLIINYGNAVLPAPLQTQAPTVPGPATVSGWGALTPNGLNSEQLQSLSTTTLSYSNCTAEAAAAAQAQGVSIPAIYEQREICTSQAVGTGNCNGDQGNGLKSASGFLIGVLSWTLPCGVGAPEIYSRINFYYPWIQSVIS